MRRIAIEILLILVISLFLSLIYTVVSPEGMHIFKKVFQKKAEVLINSDYEQSPRL